MATDEVRKDPTNTNSATNPDSSTSVDKRRVTNLLPFINRTDAINKFFDGSIDHLFQPADFKKINGLVGRKTFYWDPEKEFYLDEKTQSRIDYQFEPAAISKDSTGNLNSILFYEDLINHLRFQGAIVTNHNRLFEQEYYSWSPPVDLDKITAFWNYFWLPEGPNAITITSPTDVSVDLLGKAYPDASDPVFGDGGTASATSGLKIILTNDANPLRNNIPYIIEGVGRNIILVEDLFSASTPWDSPPGPEWDTLGWDQGGDELETPDYIVMERGAKDSNLWSVNNRWFHKDVIEQSNTLLLGDVSSVQATRPIIEFARDVELYKFSQSTLGSVDLVYEGTNIFGHLNNYQVWIPGNYPENSVPPTDWINGQHGLVNIPAYYDSSGTLRSDVDGFTSLRDGMRLLVTSDSNSAVNNKIYEVSGIRLTGLVNLVQVGVTPINGSQVSVKFGENYSNSLFIFNGIDWEEGQRKVSVNQPPLFQLYDSDKIKLDDPGVYLNSTFKGNKIFNFKPNNNGTLDSILGFALTYDTYGEIVYENFIVTERYTAGTDQDEIAGYYFYRVVGDTSSNDRYSNNWMQIDVKTQQYIVIEKYFDYSKYPNVIPEPYIQLPTLPGTQISGGLPTIIVKKDGVRINEGSGYILFPEFSDPENNYVGPAIVFPGSIDETTESYFIQIQLFNNTYVPEGYEYWEIPLNLQANPNNLEVETISAGQYFDHFSEIINNQNNLDGVAFGTNNWRDTPQDRSLGRQIMQHRAPLLKLIALASGSNFDPTDVGLNLTDNLDFMLAVTYVEREYARVKNKLLQKFNQYRLDSAYFVEPATTWVSDALVAINIGRTNSFPFYYSEMIYRGSFIPSTPSRLGIYRVYKPEAYIDDTFVVPTLTIRGHDGSQYIMFGDINGGGPTSDPNDLTDPRDAAYLEFENQIYNSIPLEYKTESLPDFNYQTFVPGKFRTTDYSRNEFLQITQPMFERWISIKGVDYRENNDWSPDNKFTWNYGNSLDVDGQRVPGNWRGIYLWYFDTDRPHTHPWEMLGFSEQPSWWVTEYGPAPWTGGNTIMWADLQDGYVRGGSRQGTDLTYARPGLLKFIPVDPSGKLLDPVSAGIIPQNPTYEQATADWKYGDVGPYENVWVKSEYYPYAISQSMYLMKPARFIELGWDPIKWEYKFSDTPGFQWINSDTKDRPSNADLSVHGETLEDGSIYIGSGIQQWISDWVISRGQNVTNSFGNVIRGLDVQLAHKMGGFTDSTNLRLLTDNFGLVPTEDIAVRFHESPSIKECIYSGVIIEWTGNGWAVFGYDVLNPVFNTIPGDINGPKITIKVGEPEIELPDLWEDNTAYEIGNRVRYQSIIYEAIIEHTSTSIFQRDKWKYIGTEAPDTGIRVLEYTSPNPDLDVTKIPYGTVFKTQQDVYSFLIDYERWLESEGWLFDEIDNITNDTLNWRRSGKEYLNWSLNSWTPGSFIALSPSANKTKFVTSHGAIQSVERLIRGVYPLLDKTGVKINPADTTVTRYANNIIIEPTSSRTGIYACRLSIKEFEHILTVSNTTIFNDLIYDVLFNVRQARFTINGILTNNWTGRLDAPGFIVNDDVIYSNYEKTVSDFEEYFAIETSPSDPVLRDHARHLTGFQFRDYLQALLVDPDVSFEFYQGMIQAKGTPYSFNELIKTEQFADQEKLNFFEEWAFRVGNFGAMDIRPSIELQLDRSEIRNNPQLIEFSSSYQVDNLFDKSIQLGTNDSRWLIKPDDINNIWPTRGNLADNLYDLPSAGYVRFDEVNYYVNNFSSLEELITNTTFVDIPEKWLPYTSYLAGDFVYYQSAIYEAIESHTSSVDFANDTQFWFYNSNVPSESLKERETIWVYNSEDLLKLGEFAVYRITEIGSVITQLETGSAIIALDTAPNPPFNIDSYGFEYLAENIDALKLRFNSSVINTGDIVFIPEALETDPDLRGIHRIFQIVDEKTFAVETSITSDFNYTTSEFLPPKIFLLQNMRVSDYDTMINLGANINLSGTPLTDGELFWVDDARTTTEIDEGIEKYWAVYSYQNGSYVRIRKQVLKVESECIINGVVYDKRRNRINVWLEVFDPRKGIIPGVADKEIWFKLDYDPAKYTNGDETLYQIDPELAWGPDEVGRLWWDLSTVRYPEYEIDDHAYRDRWWGKVAPGTSVDIYEWVRSNTEPTASDPDIRNSDNPAWVLREEFDTKSGLMKYYYYFWKKNVNIVPDVVFRKIPAVQVAQIISNPTSAGINWFCPIGKQALTLANAEQFLVDEDTVLQINWKANRVRTQRKEVTTETGIDLQLEYETICNDSGNIHRQWELLREGDASSIPSESLQRKLKDSLVGVNSQGELVPDLNLSEVEKYGTLFRPRQTWFKDLQEARKVYIQKINSILLAENIVSTREDWDKDLYLEEPEPDAVGTLYTIDSLGVLEYELPVPFSNSSQVSITTNLDGIQFTPVDYSLSGTNKLTFVLGNEPVVGDIINVTIKNYDYKVVDLAARNALVGIILPGQIVLVEPTVQTNGRWTVWLYDPSPPPIPTWKLLDTQAYKVENMWYYVDWYASGYSSDTEINYTFADYTSFEATLNVPDDQIPYVDGDVIKIEDNGHGQWNLILFTDSGIEKAAEERGTIQISDIFYTHVSGNEQESTTASGSSTNSYTDDLYGYDSSSFEEVPYDALPDSIGYPYTEFSILIDTLNENILSRLEINLVFFTMVRYVHTEQNMIDWVFKTSYIYLISTEEQLTQLPVLRTDLTDNYIDYINEAKPYHVKIRDYQQNKQVPIEIYNCLATDFDNPPYLDPEHGQYRPLDIRDGDDEDVVINNRPWSEWYDDYLFTEFDSLGYPKNAGPNVRKLKTSLHFDRVKCWTDLPISGPNTENITFMSSAPLGDYVLFTITNSKIEINEIRVIVENPISITYVGDGLKTIFRNPRVIKQGSSITVSKITGDKNLGIYTETLLVEKSTLELGDDKFNFYKITDAGVFIQLYEPLEVDTDDFKSELRIDLNESFDEDSFITIGDSDLGNERITLEIDGQLKDFVGTRTIPIQESSYNFDTNIVVHFNPGVSTRGIVRVEMDYTVSINFSELDVSTFDAADRVALLYAPPPTREQKILEIVPNQDRIKGITFTTSDTDFGMFYRKKYAVSPLSDCEYKGVIHESQNFVASGFDTYEFSVIPFDLETPTANLDVIINGGLNVFDIFAIQVTPVGWDILEWDEVLSFWDGGINYTYTLPKPFSSSAQVFVSVNGAPPLVYGVDYILIPPDTLDFIPSAGAIKLGDVIQIVMAPFGQTFIGAPLGESDIVIDGHEFLQPYHDEDHPEELIKISPLSTLNLDIYYESKVGCPIIITDRIVSDGVNFEYELLQVPQNKQAVWVYVGEQLLNSGTDYVFDQTANSIKLYSVPPSGTSIKITTFSPGGERIVQQLYFTADGILGGVGDPIKLEKNSITQNVTVFVNGELSNFIVDGRTVIISPTPVFGTQIQVTVFSPDILEKQFNDAGLSTFTLTTTPVTEAQIQVLINDEPAVFSLIGQNVVLSPAPDSGDKVVVIVYETPDISIVGTDTFVASITGNEIFGLSRPIQPTLPIEAGVFVRKNGLRVRPEHPWYQISSDNQTIYTFPEIVDVFLNPVSVWVNNVPLSSPADFTYNYVSGTLVDSINFVTPLQPGHDIVVIVNRGEAKFRVINSASIEVYDVDPGDLIQISYFSFDDTWKVKTEVFEERLDGVYDLAQSPYNYDYIWVYINGYRKIINRDYLLRTTGAGFDSEDFSTSAFDDEELGRSQVLMNPYLGVAAAYSTHPDALINDGGCVVGSLNNGWDITPWESTVNLLLPLPPIGPLSNTIISHPWDCDYNHPDMPWFDVYGFDFELAADLDLDEVIITTVAGPPIRQRFGYKMFGDRDNNLSYTRIADSRKLVLREDLYFYKDSLDREKQILLDVNPQLHISSIDDEPLYIPTSTLPGLLFINGERIEYWEVQKFTDSLTGRPYYRIPFSSIVFGNPTRTEKQPRFLRRTKGTALGAPESINGLPNNELIIPKGTIVIPCGPGQSVNSPFETGNAPNSIKVQSTPSIITGNGINKTFPIPITPLHSTIISAWTITGPNLEDRVLRTDYVFSGNNIVFNTPIPLSVQVELVAVDPREFDISVLDTSEAIFLRSKIATYEKINN